MLPELHTAIPGPRSTELAARLRKCESQNVTYVSESWPVFWERAEGCNVWDADGNRFLDFTSAFGVASLGHAHPPLRAALVQQSQSLMHAMGDVHPSRVKVELCERLSALTFERWGAGPGKTILGNSGFEAIEAALKTALLCTGKPGVIAFEGAYHGLGFGALAAAGIPYFREPFRRQLKDFATLLPYPGCYRCPRGAKGGERVGDGMFPSCSADCMSQLREDLERTIQQGEIGCILVEPIQGRGGCVVPPLAFLRLLRQVCDEHRILLIADEIFTGFHRTGALFACDHAGVVPDVICLGKALTGGFPLSACTARAEVMDAWPASHGEALHTSTYLGNPMGCAMALAALELHAAPALAQEVSAKGALCREMLKAIRSPRIGDVRGAGLMLGVELIKPGGEPDGATALRIVAEALKAGILLLPDAPAANVISIQPPFSIGTDEIAWFVNWFSRALES